MSSEHVLELTDENFEQQVLQSPVPVLVDFWADWCMPCKMLAPTIDELAADYAGKVKVGKVNTDSARDTALKFKINAIPTLIVFKGGKVQKKWVGLTSKNEITTTIDGLL